MTQRREPTISGIRAESEDTSNSSTASHRGATTKSAVKKTAVKKDVVGSSRSSAPRPAPQQVITKTKTPYFAYFLVLIALGGTGFTYWQMLESNKLLTAANMRIADLESRLDMSGDETEASTAAVQAKLKWADSEIRKLWGVSFDTNKKAIASNKTNVDSLTGKFNRLNKTVDSQVKQFSQTKDSVGKFSGEIDLLNELVSANQASLESAETLSQMSASQSRELQEKVKQLENTLGELRGRVGDHDQAIEAIDAFRRQVNQTLLNGG